MVIASKPKTRQSVHHKRRTGQHQPHTKHFMKTYWPYLPMMGLAAIFNAMIARSTALTTSASVTPTPVSRLQVWTHSGPEITAVVLGVVIVFSIVVVSRHTVAWQRAFVKGEEFFVHHHMLDLILVSVILAGVIATRMV
ncbi:MAG: hypothetical protein ACQR33_02465 [Candidatus Saccharibacteria bacterium]